MPKENLGCVWKFSPNMAHGFNLAESNMISLKEVQNIFSYHNLECTTGDKEALEEL